MTQIKIFIIGTNVSNKLVDAECATDLTVNQISAMEEEIKRLNAELYELRAKVLDTQLNEEAFQGNEEKTEFYTGLPNFMLLMQVFNLCEDYITHTPICTGKV